MGYEITDVDGFKSATKHTTADAAYKLAKARDSLRDATMPKHTLGVLEEIGLLAKQDLPGKYNSARDAAVRSLEVDIKSIVASVDAIEKAIHEYNGADEDALDKVMFADGDPRDPHPGKNHPGGGSGGGGEGASVPTKNAIEAAGKRTDGQFGHD